MTDRRPDVPDRTRPRRHGPGGRSGFTLTELLVVISIIVLMLAMAVPLFNVMNGGQGVDSAQNTVSAMLQRARSRAIGLQERRGIFFFDDQGTGKTGMLMVRLLNTASTAPPRGDTLELDDDNVEVEYLPKGVGAAFLVPAGPGSLTPTDFRPYGLVMFDGLGRVETLASFQLLRPPPVTALQQQYGAGAHVDQNAILALGVGGSSGIVEPSHAAFVLYERRGFTDQGAPTGATVLSQPQKDWLDKNAVALVVNRYNGTLIRGE